jgi:hypothetical protein
VASGLPQILAAVLEERVVPPGAVLVATRAGSDADSSELEVIHPMAMEERTCTHARSPTAHHVAARRDSRLQPARHQPQYTAAAAHHPIPPQSQLQPQAAIANGSRSLPATIAIAVAARNCRLHTMPSIRMWASS